MSKPGGRVAGIAIAALSLCALAPTAEAGLTRYGNLELAYSQTTNAGGPPPPLRNEHATYSPCGGNSSAGLSLLSGGARIFDSDPLVTPYNIGQAWVVSLFPTGQIKPAGPDSYSAVYDNRSANASLTRGDAAVCGDVNGLAYPLTDKRTSKRGRTVLKAPCPGSKHVLGGGVRATGPFLSQRVVGSAPYDSADPGKKRDDGWRAVVDNLSGKKRKMTAAAVCGAVNGLSYRTVGFDAPKRERAHAEASCPAGQYVIGGGASHGGKVGKVSVVATYPDGEATHDHWYVEVDNLSRKRLSGRVYAICHS